MLNQFKVTYLKEPLHDSNDYEDIDTDSGRRRGQNGEDSCPQHSHTKQVLASYLTGQPAWK